MSSIASITSTSSLSKPGQAAVRALPEQAIPANAAAPVRPSAVASDSAEVSSGQAALGRVATTPLWSANFELPKQPELPAASKKPWDWESTPDITQNYAGGSPSMPRPAASWAMEASQAFGGQAEPEGEDMNFFDVLTWPIRTITGGVVQGAKTVVETWQNVGQTVGEGVKTVVGAIGHGVQQAAGHVGHALQGAANAVGDAAAGAWKAITSFRLW